MKSCKATYAKNLKFLGQIHSLCINGATQGCGDQRQAPPTLNSGIDIGGVGVVDWVSNIRSGEDGNDRGCEINQFVF